MSTLYQDHLITITDEELVFNQYYFPFGGDRHVPLNAIAHIQARPPSFFGGSWRLWGTGDFRTWSPMDWRRPSRDRIFVASLRNSARRIGFTVEDSPKVISILKAKGLLQDPSAS